MSKRLALLMLAATLGWVSCFPAQAGEGTPAARHFRPRPPIEVTITGMVVKNIWKDPEGKMRVAFSIESPGGDKIVFATGHRMEDGQPTLAQLDKFTDKTITVVGKGMNAEDDGKPVLFIISVTRILVVDPEIKP